MKQPLRHLCPARQMVGVKNGRCWRCSCLVASEGPPEPGWNGDQTLCLDPAPPRLMSVWASCNPLSQKTSCQEGFLVAPGGLEPAGYRQVYQYPGGHVKIKRFVLQYPTCSCVSYCSWLLVLDLKKKKKSVKTCRINQYFN